MLYSLDKHQFIFSRDVKFFENIFPFKDSDKVKNDTTNVFQDVNHINFFDIEYHEIPNDNERVDPKLNSDQRSQSDSSSSSKFGNGVNTVDFPVNNSGNDDDSSDNIVATQNEEVATLEYFFFSEGNLNLNQNNSQGVQPVKRSSRQSVFPKNYNDFMVESKVKYGLEKFSSEIDRYIARLVTQRFGQKEGINYEEIFSLVVEMTPRQWNAKLTSILVENGFSQSKSDYSLYTKSDKGVFLALLVYVDDIIVTSNNVSEIEKF
ncbi:ribonuclease H-like domain-containing protein [Tanacetum coccineum]